MMMRGFFPLKGFFMFTGIIEGLGTLRRIRSSGTGKRITIETDFDLEGTKIGDSIAVNGACLTAVVVEKRRFEADVSPETLSATTLGNQAVGARVNVERALRISDRLDGHLVSGHIDGTGHLTQKAPAGNAILLTFAVPDALSRYMVKKGSVAVDGISLTINRCDGEHFEVSIIPHTAEITNLGFKQPGDRVNIETDMIGKYVERFVNAGREDNQPQQGAIDKEMLYRTGFI